ncbi:gluconeogenesis factor YvcK family protein [Pseudoalteromonas phenolica]|uniref:gluconeogenesis factor YvcK family protein n=1 Tax=Pseudoalteromonas phenolica TaxID=161398 RepID=UPI00110AA25D|nr:uridine diphosphate-N-acetylglucosamine-binding protein YvcK [Pseudoalteromonas phenolica]TMO56713.1 hypothetical protein CWC21_05945 [Pseudoalteromonas phenolica]
MRIVCIGGGHGLSTVLEALNSGNHHLSAIIATTDNGGSTGRLRADKRLVALGDIRRCIDTLANKDHLMSVLSQHRFSFEHDAKGHSVGNLILSALCELTQSPTKAIQEYSRLLNVEHAIYPMSESPVDLIATSKNGTRIKGECEVDALSDLPQELYLSDKLISAVPEAVRDIYNADMILIGPGSALTSITPPLLVNDIKNALLNTSACRIFIENVCKENSVMSKVSPCQHASWLSNLIGYKFFDLCLSVDALGAMDTRVDFSNLNSEKLSTHNKQQLKFVIESMITKPNKKESSPLIH